MNRPVRIPLWFPWSILALGVVCLFDSMLSFGDRNLPGVAVGLAFLAVACKVFQFADGAFKARREWLLEQ